jgi:hypothetical protein
MTPVAATAIYAMALIVDYRGVIVDGRGIEKNFE